MSEKIPDDFPKGWWCLAEGTTIMAGDILEWDDGHKEYADAAIGLDAAGHISPRVYRRIPVPKPGDLDNLPPMGTKIEPAPVGSKPTIPTDAAARKALPIFTGCLDYFPDAILAVAAVSVAGSKQHHPGKPLHWDKSKSTDHADSCGRHLLERGTLDTDGHRHSAKAAWRALANLQIEIENERT
jgi:hypothetical protein